jgi:hypothetical protein
MRFIEGWYNDRYNLNWNNQWLLLIIKRGNLDAVA